MAFATYRDIVNGSSGSSKSRKFATYQDIKKNTTPAQFEENRKRLQETNDRNLQIERQKKQEEVLKKSQAETEKYLQDFNDASTGFGGTILKRFGIGAAAPSLAPSPVTQSPAYQQSQQIGAENTANLGKTVGANLKQAAKSLFTENTTNTIYDTVFQSGVDKKNLDVIENNTKKIVELHNKKKISTEPAESKKLDTAIGFLLEQNRQVAEQVGGEIKDKSNLQLIGQSVGTAMELLPLGVGSGMTQAGKLILEAGTKQALKALGKEAALYGATVSSAGKAQEKGATTGDVAKSGVIGGLTGLATIAIPGLAKWATKDGGKYIQNLFKKISTDGTQSLSKEESAALKEIVTSKEEVPNNTSVTEQPKTEVKPTPEDPLLQEAGKYKSAEEFVNAKMEFKPKDVKIVKVDDLPPRATMNGVSDEMLADVKKNGIQNPIVIDKETGTVLDGNTRAAAAKRLGIKEVPAIYVKEVDYGFDAIEKNSNEFSKTKSQLTDLYNKAQGGVESPLLQEARSGKYANAEEFVKAQGTPVFRGAETSELRRTNGDLGNAYYLTEDKNLAGVYAGKKNTVHEYRISQDAKIADQSIIPYGVNRAEWAKENGYDGISYEQGKYAETERFNKSRNIVIYDDKALEKIKTKSQLTDLYNKAQEKRIDTSLTEQPKPDATPGTVAKGESVTAKKMNERFGKDEQLSTEYDVIGINNESDKAANLILKDRNKAIKTAFTDSGSNTEKIAILNELFEKSVVDNDHELSTVLFNRIKQLSTQTAQSLNMFKALTEVNPHYTYMSEVVNARLNGVRVSAGNIMDALKKESKQSRVRTKVTKQTKELKETLSNSVKFEKAQKVFNDLICK